jgi:hypothetical protein
VEAFGRRDNGVGVTRRTVDRGSAGTLRVRARVGVGNVMVERASAHHPSRAAA